MFNAIRKFFQRKRDVSAPKDANTSVGPPPVPEVSAPSPSKHAGGRPPQEFNRVEAAMLKLQGRSYREIARKYGVSKSFVHQQLRDWMVPKVEEPKVGPVVAPEPSPSAMLESTLAASVVEEQIPEPASVEHIVEAQPPIPDPVTAPESVQVTSPDERPVDWDEERRTDLPMRSPRRIAYLLKFETEQQTRDRILNDQMRYLHQRNGRSVFDRVNQQAHIVPGPQINFPPVRIDNGDGGEQ